MTTKDKKYPEDYTKEEIDDWIKECDVDGRMIVFEFFDSDIQDLKNCIKREVEKGRKEALEEVEKMFYQDTENAIKNCKKILEKYLDDEMQLGRIQGLRTAQDRFEEIKKQLKKEK